MGAGASSGIFTVGWSPDSRTLAFAGEMIGPTSDLYVYDRQTREITQLTSGPEQIQWLTWSPDGKWILHGTTNEFSEGQVDTFHAARSGGSLAKTLSDRGDRVGWATTTIYTLYSSENGLGDHNLRNLNIETGKSFSIWQDGFMSFAFDPKNDILAISGWPSPVNPDIATGIYLVYPNGTRKLVVEDTSSQTVYRGTKKDLFVTSSTDGTLGISKDGIVTKIGEQTGWISLSPNLTWMILYDWNNTVMDVYSENDQPVRQIPINPDVIVWRPDSTAIFLISNPDLQSSTHK